MHHAATPARSAYPSCAPRRARRSAYIAHRPFPASGPALDADRRGGMSAAVPFPADVHPLGRRQPETLRPLSEPRTGPPCACAAAGPACLAPPSMPGCPAPDGLHDLFVTIEAMTPGEFRQGGAGLAIGYGFAPSLFGEVLVAATSRGICHIAFADDRMAALERGCFVPPACFRGRHRQPVPALHANAALQAARYRRLDGRRAGAPASSVARPFQMKVWEALLRIPGGGAGKLWRCRGGGRRAGRVARCRNGGRRQPCRPADPLPPRDPAERRGRRLSLGRAAKAGHHRLGGRVRPCRQPGAMTARHDPSRRRRRCGSAGAARDGSLTMAGNRRLKIYGRLDCPAGRRMKPRPACSSVMRPRHGGRGRPWATAPR